MNDYEKKGYQIIRQLISPRFANYFWSYFELLVHNKHDRIAKESVVDHADALQGDPAFDCLSVNCLPQIELVTKKTLLPTYTFSRIYRTGSELKKHKDRPACEHSVSLCLGNNLIEKWPLSFIDFEGNVASPDLEPGDAVVYRGIELEHWRDVFKGHKQCQLFMHYVDKDGPYSEWVYDKRAFLGL
tara:strand:+ start:321 stop:878 length:558 start_codon:yes stop_codon:yes gene_type:complete